MKQRGIGWTPSLSTLASLLRYRTSWLIFCPKNFWLTEAISIVMSLYGTCLLFEKMNPVDWVPTIVCYKAGLYPFCAFLLVSFSVLDAQLALLIWMHVCGQGPIHGPSCPSVLICYNTFSFCNYFSSVRDSCFTNVLADETATAPHTAVKEYKLFPGWATVVVSILGAGYLFPMEYGMG